jgi:hypothetical protein
LSAFTDEAWTKKQVCNLWLDGASQEHLSKKLGISVGTVNKIIQDLIGNDKQLVLMREISISAKKNNIDIPQIAANLRYENMIKRLGLEKDKLEMCLRALGSILSENEVTPEIFSNLFYAICSVVLKEQKSLSQVADEVKSRNEKVHELDDKIQEKERMVKDAEVSFKRTMESNKMSIEKMNQIMDTKKELEFFGVDFDVLFDLCCLLSNFRVLGHDPNTIVKKFSKIIFLESVEAEMKRECEQLRLETEELGKYVASKQQAVKILIRLFRRGISEQDLLNVLDIIEQHIYHLTISQLTKHINDYGHISAAKFQLLMKNTELASENESLKSSNHMMRVKERYYLPQQEIHTSETP